MKRINYITYNDSYGGIYQSQVIDVIEFLNKEFNINIKLIAFVPIRIWKEQRVKIKKAMPSATVYPILGSLKNIKLTSFLLYIHRNRQVAFCRGALAFSIARERYKKCIYDGRAAVEAEVKEYNVTQDENIDKLFIKAELEAIKKADYLMSVSSILINYWEKKLNKKIPKEKYTIIPCTLTSKTNKINKQNNTSSIKIVYSGGVGPWQSFEKMVILLENVLKKQSNVELLFLTKKNKHIEYLTKKYKGRVSRKWLNHSEVYEALYRCDYGILLREDKVTNRVASPVKFAEYLNAGLKVIISPNIGDFSDFTQRNSCGLIVNNEIPLLEKNNDKNRIINLCKKYFYKDSEININKYKEILQRICTK